MTDLASLALKIDASQVNPAATSLDRLTASGERAERATNGAGKEWVRASSAAGKLRMEQLSAAAAAEKMASSNKGAGAAAAQMARDAQQAAATVSGVTKATNGAAFASRNLNYQLVDMAQGLAMGAPPLMVMMQQLPQAADAFSMLAKESGGAGAALSGLATKFLPVAAAVGVAIAAIKGWQSHINTEHKAELDAYANSLGLTAAQMEKAGGAAVTAGDLIGGLWDVIREAIGLDAIISDLGSWFMETFYAVAADAKKNLSEIYGAVVALINGVKHVWNNFPAIIGEAFQNAVNAAIGAVEQLINAHINGLNRFVGMVNGVMGTSFGTIGDVELGRVKVSYAGAGAAASQAFTGAYNNGRLAGEKWIQGKIDAVEGAAIKRRNKRLASAVQHANSRRSMGGNQSGGGRDTAGRVLSEVVDKNLQGFNEMTAAIDDQIRSVKAANDTIGMYGKSLYQFSALQDLINDAEKRGIKLTNEQKEALAKKALALGELKAQGDVLRFMEDFRVNTEAATRAMTTERGEIGLTGAALYAYRFEQEAISKAIEAHVNLSPEHLAAIHNAAKAYGDNAAALDEQKDATQHANDELRDMISLLQGIGGLGNVFGGLLGGLMTGDFKGLGAIGSIANIFTKKGGLDDYGAQGKAIADKVADVFKVGSDFANTISSALQGAATGSVAGSAVLGKQGAAGQLGGMVGGALGQLGGQALGKALGSLGAAAGPLGAIVGGIVGTALGGIVGGMLKKTKWARADISGSTSDDIRNRSNSGKYEGAVNEAASSVIKGLNDIAEQLGGVAGEFGSIAIGIRDGSYRVNTTGKSLKKSGGAVDFGEDGAAAVAYAIQQAIKKGAIDGINQSVLNLLQASGDFEEQLSKAVQLQNIFAEVASAADPMGYEMEQLAKKFVSINALLAEANATPEEVAQVEAYQKQQEAAIRQRYAEEAAAKRATQLEKEAELLLLQGKATQALAKQREAELSQMDASLVALQKQIYAETDLATRRALQIQLLEAQGNAEAAKAAQRAEEMRATEDVNKALQQQIYLTQDLRDAYDRQTESIQGTIDEMKGLGDTLKEFRKSIYATDETTLSTTQAMVKLMTTGALAATGDKTALGDLSTVGRDYLDAAKASAGSMLDYQRAQALVANYTDKAIGYTDNAVSEGEQQLALMKSQAASLISIDESAQSFEDALNKLVAHNQATTAASTPAPTQNSQQGQNGSNGGNNRDLRDGIDGLRRAFERMTRKWNEMAPEGPMQVEVVS
jgi:hypothetical protein